MIQVTFLGVGAALPAPGRTNCAYLIEASKLRMLFDCGPAILQQLAAVGKTPGDVTHAFISHSHGDHALGWPMFLLWWALEGRKANLPLPIVVASTQTWKRLRLIWEHTYSDIPWSPYEPVELPVDTPGRHALTPDVTMSTWPMVHSETFPVLGARFEIGERVLAFTADTARCPNVLELARGADLLVHDSRYGIGVQPLRPDQGKFHCAAQDAGEYAQASGVKNLALVHIGAEFEGRHAELVAEATTTFSGHVFAPAPGEVFQVK